MEEMFSKLDFLKNKWFLLVHVNGLANQKNSSSIKTKKQRHV